MSLSQALNQISIGSTLDAWYSQEHATRCARSNANNIRDSKFERICNAFEDGPLDARQFADKLGISIGGANYTLRQLRAGGLVREHSRRQEVRNGAVVNVAIWEFSDTGFDDE